MIVQEVHIMQPLFVMWLDLSANCSCGNEFIDSRNTLIQLLPFWTIDKHQEASSVQVHI